MTYDEMVKALERGEKVGHNKWDVATYIKLKGSHILTSYGRVYCKDNYLNSLKHLMDGWIIRSEPKLIGTMPPEQATYDKAMDGLLETLRKLRQYKCECGLEASGSMGQHSEYCPKYEG